MKKVILLFAAALMAIVALVPEASALPVFARQTGMACSACHFQHFPLLNSFGRAFKSSGYTMIGAQSKVEDVGLSLPGTLNMAVLTTVGYEKSNQNNAAAAGLLPGQKTTGDGYFYMPGTSGELSLFFGGRVSENAGFLSELGLLGANDAASLGSAKLPIFFEVSGGTHVGVVPFTTGAQGASYGFEILNTGANAVHQMTSVGGLDGSHSMAVSAQQYINTGGVATGFSFVANNPMGFVNLTRFNQIGPQDVGTGAGLDSNYVRLAGTFDVAGWDAGVGVQSWSGSSLEMSSEPFILEETRATAVDAQMQGTLGGMPVGFYLTYARAPAPAPGMASDYNMANVAGVMTDGTLTRSAFNIAGEVGVLHEKLTLGMALRRGQSGQADAAGGNMSDNAIMLTLNYKLMQNMMLTLNHTSQTGGFWTEAQKAAVGSSTTTLNLFTLF